MSVPTLDGPGPRTMRTSEAKSLKIPPIEVAS